MKINFYSGGFYLPVFHFHNRMYLPSENSDESWNLQILHINILHTLRLAFKSSTTRSLQQSSRMLSE
jgi:hypothetical protein